MTRQEQKRKESHRVAGKIVGVAEGLTMYTGTVKFFNKTKGFGFIVNAVTGEEIFVHATGLAESVKDGDPVTFDVTEGVRGLRAINVRLW
jgi:cold shock protein